MCSKYVNLNSMVNVIGRTYIYDHLMSTKIFKLTTNKIFICAPKIRRKWLWSLCRFANHFILIACFISFDKWATLSSTLVTLMAGTVLFFTGPARGQCRAEGEHPKCRCVWGSQISFGSAEQLASRNSPCAYVFEAILHVEEV